MIDKVHSLIRSVLRSAGRGVVLRKRLPADLGSGVVFCSPESLLSVWQPGWRSEHALGLFDWARRFVEFGNCVWDLGANQGLFTFGASFKCGARGLVVAFEPDLFLVDLLRRSVASGTHFGSGVHILPMAVGGSLGIAEFAIARTDRALNHLVSSSGNPRTGGAREITLVQSAPLDWLVDHVRAPDLVKIDIEGSELQALRGAHRLLAEFRPVLIVESAPENACAVGELLASYGYLMSDARDPTCTPRGKPAWNTLAWPRDRSAFVDRVRAR